MTLYHNLYYEITLNLLCPGGLILIDNTLWFGRVVNLKENVAKILTIRELNKKLKSDNRVDVTLVPMYDGLTQVYKR